MNRTKFDNVTFGEAGDLIINPEQSDSYMGQLSSREMAKLGTFSDSKSAPIHRWFQYPAGFSYKAVEFAIEKYRVEPGDVVYDPFLGSGTTSVVCKGEGIESYGCEAHPFVTKITSTKLNWDYNYNDLNDEMFNFVDYLKSDMQKYSTVEVSYLPELLLKCFSKKNLQKLIWIRNCITDKISKEHKNLFDVALIGTLRKASGAATGWPYIAPKKKINEKDGIDTYIKQIMMCVKDLNQTPKEHRNVKSQLIEGDSRKTNLPSEFFNFAFTSPPYLNNYDYADRTRLESYFMEYANTWKDISDKVRTKLIISATTQINRSKYKVANIVCDELQKYNSEIAKEIQIKVDKLSEIRLVKGGKKSYDIMVGQYMNDMTKTLIDTYRIMKSNSHYLLILGDSAPYGIHIPTETYLGKIALGIGFSNYKIYELRKRGDKWRNNPQRHHVPLRESILELTK